MMISGAVFDLDGTLLDSNGYWNLAPDEYLKTLGKRAAPDLAKTIFTMTLPEAAEYMTREYGLTRTPDEISEGVNAAMERFYRTEIPLKDGVQETLELLGKRGIPLAIASVTDRPLVESAMRRFGLLDRFQAIVTIADVGVGKHAPDVYLEAARRLGSSPGETLVFEDALHALQTAKKAGFITVGVYDDASKDKQEEISGTADYYLKSLRNIGEVLL